MILGKPQKTAPTASEIKDTAAGFKAQAHHDILVLSSLSFLQAEGKVAVEQCAAVITRGAKTPTKYEVDIAVRSFEV
jgi:hypothetical protein